MPVDEINLHSSGDTLTVTVSGKEVVAGFEEFLMGGIFNENTFKIFFKLGDLRSAAVPFFEQSEREGFEHKGDGKRVDPLPDSLLGE